jgi:hypothetical protein
MLRIFIYRKIQRLRPGLNPRTRKPEASMRTTRPPKTSPGDLVGCWLLQPVYRGLMVIGLIYTSLAPAIYMHYASSYTNSPQGQSFTGFPLQPLPSSISWNKALLHSSSSFPLPLSAIAFYWQPTNFWVLILVTSRQRRSSLTSSFRNVVNNVKSGFRVSG